MKIVQSLWTGTPHFRPRRSLLILHTLSACLALRNFKSVELVTDDLGLAISEILGWRYTSYANRLDEVTRSGLMHQWAAGKMFALLLQDQDCVHVDNDALLFGPFVGAVLHARLLAERVDNPWHYRSPDAIRARETAKLPAGAVPYNCGLIGGTDIRLLRKYAERALELAQVLSRTDLNGTVNSMAFEQYWLGEFARREGVRVETILSAGPTEAQARKAKYLHLAGPVKLEPHITERVERRLRREFPADYARFCEGWPRIERGEHEKLFVVNHGSGG